MVVNYRKQNHKEISKSYMIQSAQKNTEKVAEWQSQQKYQKSLDEYTDEEIIIIDDFRKMILCSLMSY